MEPARSAYIPKWMPVLLILCLLAIAALTWVSIHQIDLTYIHKAEAAAYKAENERLKIALSAYDKDYNKINKGKRGEVR
jgi:hypothetical protein